MYNFFTMFFFGENLKFKHKVTLCLVMLGILFNCWVCTKMPLGTFPFIEFRETGVKLYMSQLALSFGVFVKMLVIAFFRKF